MRPTDLSNTSDSFWIFYSACHPIFASAYLCPKTLKQTAEESTSGLSIIDESPSPPPPPTFEFV